MFFVFARMYLKRKSEKTKIARPKINIVTSSPRRSERAIRKRPNTVRCLAVKSTLLGTRHPRKEKEAAQQKIIGEPACLCGGISMCHTTGDGTKVFTKIYKLKNAIFVKIAPTRNHT